MLFCRLRTSMEAQVDHSSGKTFQPVVGQDEVGQRDGGPGSWKGTGNEVVVEVDV